MTMSKKMIFLGIRIFLAGLFGISAYLISDHNIWWGILTMAGNGLYALNKA